MNIPVTITAGTDITISGQYYLAPNIDYSTCKYTITFYDTVGNKVIYTFDVPELTGSGNKTFSATFKADRDLAKLDTYGIRYELNMATGALSEPTIFYFYACNISYLDSNEQIITAIDDQTEEIKDFFTPDIDIDSTLTDTSQIIRSQLGVLGFPSVLVNEVKTRIESTDWNQASITFPSIDFMGQHFFGPITFDFNALAQDISAINYLKTLLHLITGFICVYCCVRLAGRAISQIIGFVNPVG